MAGALVQVNAIHVTVIYGYIITFDQEEMLETNVVLLCHTVQVITGKQLLNNIQNTHLILQEAPLHRLLSGCMIPTADNCHFDEHDCFCLCMKTGHH